MGAAGLGALCGALYLAHRTTVVGLGSRDRALRVRPRPRA